MEPKKPKRFPLPRGLRRTFRIVLLALLSLATIVSAFGWAIRRERHVSARMTRRYYLWHAESTCRDAEDNGGDPAVGGCSSWGFFVGHKRGFVGIALVRWEQHAHSGRSIVGRTSPDDVRRTLRNRLFAAGARRKNAPPRARTIWIDEKVRTRFQAAGASVPCWFLAAIFATWPAIAFIRWIHKRRRYRIGECPSCGYNLTGNTSGKCPECGTPIE